MGLSHKFEAIELRFSQQLSLAFLDFLATACHPKDLVQQRHSNA